MLYNLIAIMVFGLFFCTPLKMEKLNPSLETEVMITQESIGVKAYKLNNILINLPLYIAKIDNKYYLPDYQDSIIKCFDKNGNLQILIGDLKSNNPIESNVIDYKLNIPGYIVGNKNGDIYVQNRMNYKENKEAEEIKDLYSLRSGIFSIKEMKSIPSYIVHFNNSQKSISIIGMTGKNSGPFRHIEKMYAKDRKLFVYHKFAEQMILSYLVDAKLKGSIKEGTLDINTIEEFEKYKIKLDTIIPHLAGEYALAAFSYYEKKTKRFKFRKIYKLRYNNPKPLGMLKEIQDPSEFLFMVKSNDQFYIWKTENDGVTIKLEVHDRNGNHINNKKIVFPEPVSEWRTTYSYNNESIFSIKIDSNKLKLYKWN